MLRIIGILLIVIVATVFGVAGGIYLYLSPEEEPPRLMSPSSVRTIESGEIVGFQGQYEAHTWLGIPYAQAPVADLRWKAPRPVLSWQGRREMMNYGSPCLQLPGGQGPIDNGVYGSEDCLFLNLWAPQFGPTTVPSGEDRLPVMVWIHGGGNSVGSGGTESMRRYEGALMASEHDVIVITVNYRMGPAGWFAHDALIDSAADPEDASGNFGTLDLVAALRWVQENVSAFGGDPGNVTIFGESAGGTNVLSLMASPIIKDRQLFHRAIVQSGSLRIYSMDEARGSSPSPKARPANFMTSRDMVARWLVAMGRAPDVEQAMIRQDAMSDVELAVFLRSLSPEELYGIFDSTFAGMISMPLLIGDGHVLPDQTPEQVFSDPSSYRNVPLIIGSNRDESALFLAYSPAHIDLIGGLPVKIRQPENYRLDVSYGSNLWRATGVDRFAALISRHSPDQVFSYRFDADDWRNYGFIDLKQLIGAAHTMELPFVFGYFPPAGRVIFPDSTFESVELLSGSMMSYWAEFAYSGDPGRGRSGKEVHWLPWRMEDPGHYLQLDTEIDGGITMSEGVLTEEGVRASFISEAGYSSKEAHCRGYQSVFRNDFSRQEYESLGCR